MCIRLCILLYVLIGFSNYGPTIRTQIAAERKGHQQVLWLFGEEQQLTEVGKMNLFVNWINEDGGRKRFYALTLH